MTANPAFARAPPTRTPMSYAGCVAGIRAEPNTEIAGPISARSLKPSTNSAWIFSTRHGSVCTQSASPVLSSSRWSVVEPSGRPALGRGPGPLRLVMRSPGCSGCWGRWSASSAQLLLAAHDLGDLDVLVLLVSQHRVAGAVVDGRHGRAR